MFRRAVILLTGTAAAVTSVLAYHPPQLTPVATNSVPITETPNPTSTNPTNTNPTKPAPTTSSSANPTPTTPTQNQAVAGVFTGNVVQTRWGPVQVEITVKNGSISAASALKFPDGDQRSLSISQQAIPYLIQQTLGVVNASQVQGVTQATYTSDGWRTSLGSAIKKAGI
ncbi:MAG: FMN-binding protein [Actinobacteria bacterium]|jgi:uncharacterized protein with FMN-binding domain|uniref:Unannotated protein n=1 Tax=freshwater metagenome TaxID=449393 RepID=A0A6J6EA96_9ZZZZ|nr:FMN-binding protein [Actinomycetota bacterium]